MLAMGHFSFLALVITDKESGTEKVKDLFLTFDFHCVIVPNESIIVLPR